MKPIFMKNYQIQCQNKLPKLSFSKKKVLKSIKFFPELHWWTWGCREEQWTSEESSFCLCLVSGCFSSTDWLIKFQLDTSTVTYNSITPRAGQTQTRVSQPWIKIVKFLFSLFCLTVFDNCNNLYFHL